MLKKTKSQFRIKCTWCTEKSDNALLISDTKVTFKALWPDNTRNLHSHPCLRQEQNNSEPTIKRSNTLRITHCLTNLQATKPVRFLTMAIIVDLSIRWGWRVFPSFPTNVTCWSLSHSEYNAFRPNIKKQETTQIKVHPKFDGLSKPNHFRLSVACFLMETRLV